MQQGTRDSLQLAISSLERARDTNDLELFMNEANEAIEEIVTGIAIEMRALAAFKN